MTLIEYRLALSSLTPAQQTKFASWSDAADTVDANLAALAAATEREHYERAAVFHLRATGVDGLLTEGEKLAAAAQGASYAAKVSALAAERAALSAWWSISAAVLGLIALVVALVALNGVR